MRPTGNGHNSQQWEFHCFVVYTVILASKSIHTFQPPLLLTHFTFEYVTAVEVAHFHVADNFVHSKLVIYYRRTCFN